MNTTELILLRHGEPEHRGCLLGRLDSKATAHGIASCVEAVADLEIARIVSSPLERAAAAARAIAAATGRKIDVDERWQELDFGCWDGKTVQDLNLTRASQLEAFWRDPDGHPPPGGERWSAIKNRVAAAVADLASSGMDGPVLVVTHAGAMRAALAALCGFGFRETMRLDLPYAAQLRLSLFDGDGGSPSALIRSLKAP